MSAASATEPPHAEHATSTDFVLIRGDARTYRLREKLRAYGLEWVPDQHAWVGPLSGGRQWFLEERCGLRLTTTVPITPAPKPQGSGAPPAVSPALAPPARRATVNWGGRRPKDGGRTSLESCLALLGTSIEHDDEGGDREGRPFGVSDEPRRLVLAENASFSARETTAGLTDDTREADERRASARLRDRRGRVKAARAALAGAPGAADAMAADWRKEAAFLARFGTTQEQFWNGVPANAAEASPDAWDRLTSPIDRMSEVRVREVASLPNFEWNDG